MTSTRSCRREPRSGSPAGGPGVSTAPGSFRAAVGNTTGVTFLDDRYDRPASVIRSTRDLFARTVADGASSDRGDGPADPFAGLLPVTDTCSAGLGLWLTHQLCSHVTLDTTDDGFTIRLVVGTPQPGRSGHAPDTA